MLDPFEHPIIAFAEITLVLLGLFFALGTIIYYVEGNDNPYNYRYIDIDDNEGFAQWCNHDKNMTFYSNKGYIQVKEFHKNG